MHRLFSEPNRRIALTCGLSFVGGVILGALSMAADPERNGQKLLLPLVSGVLAAAIATNLHMSVEVALGNIKPTGHFF